jgi:lipoprotein-anchoring transpeptidase ErfK/SrfK
VRRGDGAAARRLRGTAGTTAVVALALLAAACSGSGHSASQVRPVANAKAAKAKAVAAAAEVKITPANGAKDADPSAGITVTAARGTLKNVTVHTSGDPVSGSLSQGGKVWHSQWTLAASQGYTVTATAAESGGTVTTTSTFRTLTPSRTFRTEIFEGYNQTYGVGMPIMLIFSQPITNRAAVERSLQLTTSKPVVGAWYWDDSEHLDFRPRDYWPANTQVSFTGRLNGVEGAPGMYATADLTQTFNIGASLIALVSTTGHHMRIYNNGQLEYDWAISTGKPGDDTPDGSYVTVEKNNPEHMVGPGYNLEVPWSVRFTFSGDFIHDAYWSVGQQGFENVSHGCVNVAPANAQTYYNMAVPGDPVTVNGSPSAGKWDDGWTEWFLPWQQYLKGSALHEAVQAGPDGSSFVNPSSLPASSASAPLQTPPSNNWEAA